MGDLVCRRLVPRVQQQRLRVSSPGIHIDIDEEPLGLVGILATKCRRCGYPARPRQRPGGGSCGQVESTAWPPAAVPSPIQQSAQEEDSDGRCVYKDGPDQHLPLRCAEDDRDDTYLQQGVRRLGGHKTKRPNDRADERACSPRWPALSPAAGSLRRRPATLLGLQRPRRCRIRPPCPPALLRPGGGGARVSATRTRRR